VLRGEHKAEPPITLRGKPLVGLFAALEARALGRGGVSLMARISGLARSTIYQGLSDIRERVSAQAGRVRQGGGGRKQKTIEDPTLMADLRTMLESVTRGDSMQPLM
jgi:hypothetical protein